ncbi:MAG TPA: DUF1302 domain-containing protein [Lacunisphaera sp.]|nr:DUF1302 domain-containing protein [Lacunisphaera sp.]
MKPCQDRRSGLRCLSFVVLVSSLALGPSARAFVFALGDAKGSFDTTLSIGSLYRINDPDRMYYGLASGGEQRSVNADDGNLNYRSGVASFLVKASHDLQLDLGNGGVFVRGYYFEDFINTNGGRARTALSDQALKVVGDGAELLDAYAWYKPRLGDMTGIIRVGRQVLSWGESTFIPNGINSVNPIDVAKLRTPGSELKEALRPLNMVSGTVNLNEDLSLEAFYLLDWERTRVDPPGTYFSTNDFVAKGGSKVFLGFGAVPDTASLGAIMRGRDNEPSNEGQYGVNLRWLAKGLGDTEFGFYYMNYHSRLPLVSARTPTTAIDTAPVSAQVQAVAGQLGQTQLAPVMLAGGFPLSSLSSSLTTLLGAALTGVPAAALPPVLQPYYPQAQAIAAAALADPTVTAAKTTAFFKSAATGNYLIEFPSDIHLWGASFNTSVKGVALQGEVSYRSNQPLQVDDVELLFAALSSINPAFGPNNQIGNFLGQLNTYVPGYRRHAVWTGQATATQALRGILGAEQTTLIAEAGFVSADLPAKGQLRYDGPGTFVGGDLNYMTGSGNGASGSDPASAFADSFSWGYQLVGRLDYNNVFRGVNVSPLVVFSHDVSGNTPQPLGNFLHGRKTLTIGADFSFQNAWAFEVRYVNFFGAGRFNLLGDRDYVSCNLKYSF